jgi:putative N6-adenine-specific DNA methylase
MKPFQLYAVVKPGLEQVAGEELMRNGVKHLLQVEGGFEFVGHLNTIIRLNLRLRTVSRLLLRFAKFPAHSFGEMARHVEHLPWDDFLHNLRPEFHVVSYRSELFHEGAITDRLSRIVRGAGKNAPVQRILVRLAEDQAEISLDTGGENLHKRGYAEWRGPAPLREVYAAAMVLATDWTGEPVVDPMCGSGTIPLEAWGLARGIPVAKLRDFTFKHWRIFDETQWTRTVNSPQETFPTRVRGFDIDPKMVEVARHNAEKLGSDANFEVRDVRKLSLLEPSWVMVNPPYGKRLEDDGRTYDALVRLQREGHRVFVLAPIAVLRAFKQPWNPLLRFRNGNLQVTWAEIGVEPVAPETEASEEPEVTAESSKD